MQQLTIRVMQAFCRACAAPMIYQPPSGLCPFCYDKSEGGQLALAREAQDARPER